MISISSTSKVSRDCQFYLNLRDGWSILGRSVVRPKIRTSRTSWSITIDVYGETAVGKICGHDVTFDFSGQVLKKQRRLHIHPTWAGLSPSEIDSLVQNAIRTFFMPIRSEIVEFTQHVQKELYVYQEGVLDRAPANG